MFLQEDTPELLEFKTHILGPGAQSRPGKGAPIFGRAVQLDAPNGQQTRR